MGRTGLLMANLACKKALMESCELYPPGKVPTLGNHADKYITTYNVGRN